MGKRYLRMGVYEGGEIKEVGWVWEGVGEEERKGIVWMVKE